MHIEFQTLVKKGDLSEEMPVRMATYALFVLNRYGQVPDQVLILLKDSEAARQVPDRFEQGRVRVEYDVIRLWEQDPELLLASGLVGLMPLVPLMRGEDVSSLLERCTALIESEIESGQERNEVLAVTGLLASLKDRRIVQAFFRTKSMLSLLQETPLFQELTQELVREADRRARLQFLQHQLEHKFGPMPEDVLTALQAITDVDALARLGIAVLDAMDIDAFRQQLPLRSEAG
ncbi:Rpn family recombination-promoting nuclease/putative transposase [Gloeobacter violaceus]|nr:Rpn family recombination-promoting nuclease/putative transposase [Gloeobacter violaceus]